jgi:hypothetical protein
MPKKSKTPSKVVKSKPKIIVKAAIKTKAKSNGLTAPKGIGKARSPIDENQLSAPMQAGLAAVAAMEPTNDTPVKETKLTRVIALLSRPNGATIDEITDATSWQKHTARAAISHALGKKRGYQIVSEKPKGGKRSYKIVETKP